MNVADPINILSLFSGSGMLDEAVECALRVLGFRSRVLGFCEREASAAAWLLGRMEAKTLEPAPVFCAGLEVLDARPLRGYVDLVTRALEVHVGLLKQAAQGFTRISVLNPATGKRLVMAEGVKP